MKAKFVNNLISLLIEPENDIERQTLRRFINMQNNKEGYEFTIQGFTVECYKEGVSSVLIGYNKKDFEQLYE